MSDDIVSHVLHITPLDNSDNLHATCECRKWSMVTPDPEIAIGMHRCHLLDQYPPGDPRPLGRHNRANHPTARIPPE